MNSRLLDAVLQHAATLAAGPAAGGGTDDDLLARFRATRDAAAFAELVRRHAPAVWGVCRNLLPLDADAEDAFQATFVALIRSPAAVRGGVGGWLHGTAVKVCLKVRRAAVRRGRRAQTEASGRRKPAVDSSSDWSDLAAVIHEEIARLPADQRQAFVLCGLEGLRQQDAADRLGWKLGTLSGTLTRARQRLVARLARRGVSSELVAVAAATAAAAAPEKLLAAAVALGNAPRRSRKFSDPNSTRVAKGATDMTRTKIMAAAVVVCGGLSVGLGSAWYPQATGQSPDATKGVGDLLAATQPPALPAPPAPSGGIPTTGGMGGRGGDGMAPAAPAGTVEHQVLSKPKSPDALKSLLTQFGKDGWTFAGTATFGDESVVVLSRSAGPRMFGTLGGGGFPGGSGGFVGGSFGGGRGGRGDAPAATAPTGGPSGTRGGGGLGGEGGGRPAGPGAGDVTTIALKHATVNGIQRILHEVFASDKIGIAGDPRTNQIIITTIQPGDLKAIQKVIEALDTPEVAAAKKP